MLLRSAVALLPAATLVLGSTVPINIPGHALSSTRETEPLPDRGAPVSGRAGSALSFSTDESEVKKSVIIPPSYTRVKRKSGHHNNGDGDSDSGSDSGSSTGSGSGSSTGSNSGSDDGADTDSDPTTDTTSSTGSTSSSGSSSSSSTHSNPKSKPHRNKDNTTSTDDDDDDDDDDDESGVGRGITLSISFTAGLILLATALQL